MADKSHPLPDSEFSGKNLSEVPAILESAGYGVYEWTPEKDGKGKPTMVLFVHEMGAEFDGLQIITRFKSRMEINRCIEMFKRHRDSVWPISVCDEETTDEIEIGEGCRDIGRCATKGYPVEDWCLPCRIQQDYLDKK